MRKEKEALNVLRDFIEVLNERGHSIVVSDGLDSVVKLFAEVFDTHTDKLKMLLGEQEIIKVKDTMREIIIEQLMEIINPLMDWIEENGSIHSALVIKQGRIQFFSGEEGFEIDVEKYRNEEIEHGITK